MDKPSGENIIDDILDYRNEPINAENSLEHTGTSFAIDIHHEGKEITDSYDNNRKYKQHDIDRHASFCTSKVITKSKSDYRSKLESSHNYNTNIGVDVHHEDNMKSGKLNDDKDYQHNNTERNVSWHTESDNTNPKLDVENSNVSSCSFEFGCKDTSDKSDTKVESRSISNEVKNNQMHIKKSRESENKNSECKGPPEPPRTAFMCFCAQAKLLNSWKVCCNYIKLLVRFPFFQFIRTYPYINTS